MKSSSGEPKADNIVSLGMGRYKWYQNHCPTWDGGSLHKPMRVASGHSLRHQEWDDPLRSPAGTLGLKRMWLWRPTSLEYGNENVLICIFAPILTQPVLKPWYLWTYQNSTIKSAIARVVPGWVTSWEVWFKRAKSEQYCASEVGSLHQIKIFVLRMLFYFDKFMGNSTSQLPINWFGGIASNSPS
jgi:hypothetical protein